MNKNENNLLNSIKNVVIFFENLSVYNLKDIYKDFEGFLMNSGNRIIN